MADRQHQTIALEDLGVEFEVRVNGEIETIARLLGPGDERLLPAPPKVNGMMWAAPPVAMAARLREVQTVTFFRSGSRALTDRSR